MLLIACTCIRSSSLTVPLDHQNWAALPCTSSPKCLIRPRFPLKLRPPNLSSSLKKNFAKPQEFLLKKLDFLSLVSSLQMRRIFLPTKSSVVTPSSCCCDSGVEWMNMQALRYYEFIVLH